MRHPKWGDFNIGSGFTMEQRFMLFDQSVKGHLLGRTVEFKYQEEGMLDKPRFPIFLRFRNPE